jgi:hypothetical protein
MDMEVEDVEGEVDSMKEAVEEAKELEVEAKVEVEGVEILLLTMLVAGSLMINGNQCQKKSEN